MPDFNMQPKKHPMPVQEPSERNKNFKEVALGYDAQTAIDEAKRCLNCKNKPCVSGCPVGIDIPRFIAFTAAGDFESAAESARRKRNARENARAESRRGAKPWESDIWNGLSPIITMRGRIKMSPERFSPGEKTRKKLPSSVPARRG